MGRWIFLEFLLPIYAPTSFDSGVAVTAGLVCTLLLFYMLKETGSPLQVKMIVPCRSFQ